MVRGKPFVKGDLRCWRNGRPKNFDATRTLAQQIAHEVAKTGSGENARDVVIDGHRVTVTEAILRSWAMSKSKIVHVGAWEDGRFVGVVLFNVSANNNIGKPYGLKMTEVCELVRVALCDHKTPVSRIVAQAMRMLKRQSPGLRLIVSFADPEHSHVGGIYQAMNWLYAGMTTPADEWIVNGKRWHGRAFRASKPAHLTTAEAAKMLDPASKRILGSSKHRYLYPLDRAMRRQIEPLRKPYPKRETSGQSIEGDTLLQTEGDVRSIVAAPTNNATPVLLD